MVHILLTPSLKDFERNLTSMGNKSNCMVVLILFGIALLWDWNEIPNTFSDLVSTAEFSIFAGILSAAP